jgi:hypothetical protein
MATYTSQGKPMRIQARPGSAAEARYYTRSQLPGTPWPQPKAIAPGISPAPLDDLMFHGGKVVPQMEFQNVYLGGEASWKASDVTSIDAAILRAMRFKGLNNVLTQYFPGAKVSCDMRDSFVLDEAKPARLGEPEVQAKVVSLLQDGLVDDADLATCIFNLVLPSGTVLKLDSSSSLNGLGGYHGSVHVKHKGKRVTLYYSANVYSEIRADGSENGIAVFDQPWKNVVGTLYHELNEFRTDADVNDAIATGSNDFLGWTSRAGHEIGDQPIFQAGQNLKLVFKEIAMPPGRRRTPVQLLYSNAAHGAEGPLSTPRP